MHKDEKLHTDYVQFIENTINRKHASRVPDEELQVAEGQVWFLPHFQVYHPKKPDKIRVVFDCSAVYRGDSLNKHLSQGPHWMKALLGFYRGSEKKRLQFLATSSKCFTTLQ
jgi:hypothetical protein